MAELEIHHEVELEDDPIGRRTGVQASLVAVLLAIVTILSHRTHTGAVLASAEANDAWQQYQSARVKLHSLEVGEDLMAQAKPAARARLAQYAAAKAKYEQRSRQIESEARERETAADRRERRGLRYDIGEGFLEIALVLTSLYFIARRKLFPRAGIVAGIAGVIVAATGLLL